MSEQISKSEFIRQYLGQYPGASLTEVCRAWSDTGAKDKIAEALYYQVKFQLGQFNKRTGSSSGTSVVLVESAALVNLRHRLEEILEWHGNQLASRARSYLSQRFDPEWNPEELTVMCGVEGSAPLPYTVEIYIPDDVDEPLDAICDCPYSGDIDYCKHTYAVCRHLADRAAKAFDPLIQQIIGANVSVAAPEPQWNDFFRDIDSLTRRIVVPPSVSVKKNERLTWRVGFDHYGTKPVVECYKQILSAKGKWSRGRKVSIESLRTEVDEFTEPRDMAVINCLKLEDTWWNRHYTFDTLKALTRLVGHPNVYWADDPRDPIEVVAGNLSLKVDVTESGYVPKVFVDGHPCRMTAPHAFIRGEKAVFFNTEANRISVTSMSEPVLAFLSKIAAAPVFVPKSAADQLLDRAARLENFIKVDLPEELTGATKPASTKPVLRLSMRPDDSLNAQLGIRPVDSQFETPGMGNERIAVVEENQRTNYVRNFKAEIVEAEQVRNELQLVDATRINDWQWHFDSLDKTMGFIRQLQQIPSDRAIVEWEQGKQIQVLQNIAPQAIKVQISGRRDWFGVEGMVDLGGGQIALPDLLANLRSDSRFVKVGDGQWAEIEKSLHERLMALSDACHTRKSGLEIGRTALPVIEDLAGEAVAIEASKTWNTMIEQIESTKKLSKNPPKSFQAELRDYQTDGFAWLRRLSYWGVGACLADDMGLGKTVQTLALLTERAKQGPALIVAPTSVGFNWAQETQRFAPTLNPILYREADRDNVIANLKNRDVLITSYGLMRLDFERFSSRTWTTFVLDEAQNVKNAVTKTARAARDLEADWRLALTGTPLENHIGELWSIFRVISPGLFGSWDRFKQRYADPIEKYQDKDRRHALSKLIRPFVLRRTKSEVLDELPGRTEMQMTVEFSPAERKKYEEERLKILVELTQNKGKGGDDARFQVLAALTKLRQLACHPRLVDKSWNKSSAKMNLLAEVVKEVRDGGHRALIFSQFVQHLKLIREFLDKEKIPYLYLDGQTTAKQRKERVEAFQNGEGDFFLISLKAGGTGLNLTAADYVIHVDPWWNPAVEDQATDRAHRMGQTRPVTVYRLVTKDTIEEQILALHADKRELIAGILDGTDKAAKLSTEELVSMIRAGGKSE